MASPVMSPSMARAALVRLGWPLSVPAVDAVEAFQSGWALGPTALAVDGVVGPDTTAALRASAAALAARKPTASQWFSFTEFTCKCGGKYAGCHRVWVRRPLLLALDILRARHFPGGLTITSGFRCASYNDALYRARGETPTDSQHSVGTAADIPGLVSAADIQALGRFSGIGRVAATGKATHVDVRHTLGAANPTPKATVTRPAQWTYA